MDDIAIGLIALTGVAFLLFVIMVSSETMEDADKRRGEETSAIDFPLLGNSLFYVAITIVHWFILAGLLASWSVEVEDADLYWGSLIFAIIYLVVYVLQRIAEWRNYPGLRRPCRK